MDPVSAMQGASALIGMGVEAYGFLNASKYASQATQIQQNILATDEQINQQREQQMNLDAARKMVNVQQRTQMARARTLAAAVNQGGQFGSGAAGASGSEASQAARNVEGISQDWTIGKNIFSLTNTEDQLKSQLTGVQSEESDYQAIAGLGGSITGSSQSIGKLLGGMIPQKS